MWRGGLSTLMIPRAVLAGDLCSWQVQLNQIGLWGMGLTKNYPGPPGWGLGVGLTTPPCQKVLVTETLQGNTNCHHLGGLRHHDASMVFALFQKILKPVLPNWKFQFILIIICDVESPSHSELPVTFLALGEYVDIQHIGSAATVFK